MKKRKVVLIGAGSVGFSQGLVADLILSPDLGPWELGLVDIDPQALETTEKLSHRMIEAQEAEISISASTDRRDLLPGADVVVSTIGVGGRRAWEADVFIPRKYGIYQPVGDTVMPGGISRAMRMIPAMLDIARDVKDICPDAWFFNYSNPMTAICRAIRVATGVPVMGLCHGVPHGERELAKFIGAPPEEVTSLYAGINHLTFIFDLRWRGRDAWPLARARLAQERTQPLVRSVMGKVWYELGLQADTAKAAANPFCWSLFDTYGAYSAAGDRHTVEFFPERFPQGQYYGMTLGVDAFTFEGVIDFGDRKYADMRARALGEKPLKIDVFERSAGEGEKLLDVLRSIEYDTQGVFNVNLPNKGTVPNLPADAILELPAVATAAGLRPVQILDLPDPLVAILTRRLTAVSLTVEAALSGSRKLMVEALLADGAVTDPEAARRLSEELLEAHRQYLPDFFPQRSVV